MRLGTLLLTGLSLAGQAPNVLPWEHVAPLPWRASLPDTPPEALPTPPRKGAAVEVSLAPDGALRIIDAQGVVRFRTGLPGRPLRVWRDGGTPLHPPTGTWRFPENTPLRQGLGALPLGQPDFRPALEGLLWILEDGEQRLTVVHPATGRVAHLPLPGGEHLDIAFFPRHLGVHQTATSAARPENRPCWSLPWLSLLPVFLQLSQSLPSPAPGTALKPFPKE